MLEAIQTNRILVIRVCMALMVILAILGVIYASPANNNKTVKSMFNRNPGLSHNFWRNSY